MTPSATTIITSNAFNTNTVDPSWQSLLSQSLQGVDQTYLQSLLSHETWLPGRNQIFNAFSLAQKDVRFILFGESPYPRTQSANGYAFWDAAVDHLWSETGLSKTVNRATSLRNIIKMLLLAEGLLPSNNTSQEAIAKINKSTLVTTNQHLFQNFLRQGFLLLNTTPVLSAMPPRKEAKYWQPFLQSFLYNFLTDYPGTRLLLFGRIAETIQSLLPALPRHSLIVEHPYNVSFINNTQVIDFFKPLHLLMKPA